MSLFMKMCVCFIDAGGMKSPQRHFLHMKGYQAVRTAEVETLLECSTLLH